MKRLYEILKSIIRGFYVTVGMSRKSPVTLQYPKEKENLATSTKQEHALMYNEFGELKCIACRMCEHACPAGAIKIKIDEKIQSKPSLVEFEVDYSKCLSCDLCVQACPVGSLKRFPSVDLKASYDKELLKFNKEKLAENGKKYKILIESEK